MPENALLRSHAGGFDDRCELLVVRLHQACEFIQRHRLARYVGNGQLTLHIGIFQRLVDRPVDFFDKCVRGR
jgi:hypothetical protein